MWDSIRADKLQWLPDVGLGFLAPSVPFEYGADYFAHYEAIANTEAAEGLNRVRLQMLERHISGNDVVVDVGIGAGTFIEACDAADVRVYGYDVNPRGVDWLVSRGRYRDPYLSRCHVACFWDSLEHIANPTALLRNVSHAVLVSLPIFRDASHARLSKHYKPGEHIWYFTDAGIIWFMERHDFALDEHNVSECAWRDEIHSYAFHRKAG